tara:strand:+ start:30818 stop:31801 length:984 start_codon:yes stop_codon:yes gene_type:complete
MSATKFEDSRGRTITVMSTEGNIAILNNGERVSTERLNDTRYFTPLNESISPVVQKYINNTNTNTNMNTHVNESSANIMDDNSRYQNLSSKKAISIGESENTMLQPTQRTAYNQSSDIKISGGVVESHRDNLVSIGKEVPVEEHRPKTVSANDYTTPYNADPNIVPTRQPVINPNLTPQQQLEEKYKNTNVPQSDPRLHELAGEKVSRDEIKQKRQERISNGPLDNVDYTGYVDEPINPNQEPEVNPVHQMFDKAKKVHPLNVTLKLNEKIPSKEVIKMMDENFDESAVDYYAKDIFKKLMEDPSVIENQVKEAIEKYLKSRTPKKK